MRLTEIKLAGFKSFVDPTVIPVPGNLVGIVGPNGCGKSNVIDAVRWVLGESRASALRGESLQDVIFNGSAKRKPVGRASVELVFDNSAGKVAGQWSTYNEISIKRIMQKEGESAYYINNIHVRRRDVADIFLGTGVSGRGYAIIEQGMISRIIEAKPQELRTFLEEAAGISKYRERRHETELRLSDARGNLLRLDDILEELEKQSHHLAAQGEVALRYQDLHRQLSASQCALWSLRKRQAEAQRLKAQADIEQLTQELADLQTGLQQTVARLDECRSQQRTVNDRQHRIQGELYAADGEIGRIEQNIRHMRENRERLVQQIAQASDRLQEHEQQADQMLDDLAAWRDKLEQASEYHAVCAEKHVLEAGQLPQQEVAARNDQAHVSKLREALALARQNEKLQQNQLAHAEKTLQQLTLRQQRLLDEQRDQPLIEQERLTALQQANSELATVLETRQQSLQVQETQLEAAQQEKEAALQAVQALQREMTQAKAQQDALQRLQCQLESDQDLNAWVAGHRLDALPRLWQQIGVADGWENALEAILRERIQAVSVDRLEQALDWEGQHPPGKWSACECAPVSGQSTPGTQAATAADRPWQPLGALLQYRNPAIRPVLENWLHGVFTVDSIAAGLRDRMQLAPGEMLITAEGHSLTRHSVSYFAPDSVLHGVLSRQQEIERLAAVHEALEHALLAKQAAFAQVEQDCRDIASEMAHTRAEIEQLRNQLHQQQLQSVQLAQQNERLMQRRQQLETELAELALQHAEESSQQQQVAIDLATYAEEKAALEEQLERAEAACQASGQALAAQRSLVERLAHELREAAFNEQSCHDKIADCEQRAEMIVQNKADIADTLQKLEQSQAGFDESVLLADLEHWQAQRAQHEQMLGTVRNELEAIDRMLIDTEQMRMQTEQRLHPCREAINQARLKEQEASLTEAQFADKLAESTLDELEVLRQLGHEPPTKLQNRINRLNQEIAALGPVNLAALQELEALQARRTHLDEQSQDLRAAIDSLENAIRQIDRETRERLQETFNQVNGNLVELFASVFGGGHAGLVLGGEDILDAGVQLYAHPPGKRNSSIHLLSGGEKALTALALVFSLFKLNPAPFCLLDEVDAPLDDSNSTRFCDLVKRMAGETQFLFISHNKITMQMAQQLVGVTMREQGVSRVVTVDIDTMAGIDQEAEHA
ncbi:MAG: chromosome segregation protein SMC [Nitrosomonas halophila]